jgi:hypothetical protein
MEFPTDGQARIIPLAELATPTPYKTSRSMAYKSILQITCVAQQGPKNFFQKRKTEAN